MSSTKIEPFLLASVDVLVFYTLFYHLSEKACYFFMNFKGSITGIRFVEVMQRTSFHENGT